MHLNMPNSLFSLAKIRPKKTIGEFDIRIHINFLTRVPLLFDKIYVIVYSLPFCKALLKSNTTKEGQAILRNGEPMDRQTSCHGLSSSDFRQRASRFCSDLNICTMANAWMKNITLINLLKFFSASLNCLYSTGSQTLGWLNKLESYNSEIYWREEDLNLLATKYKHVYNFDKSTRIRESEENKPCWSWSWQFVFNVIVQSFTRRRIESSKKKSDSKLQLVVLMQY